MTPQGPKEDETVVGPEREFCAYLASGLFAIGLVLLVGLIVVGGWLWLK